MAKCPYCNKEVFLDEKESGRQDAVRREVKGLMKKEVMYSCSHCDRILGFGFFIGGWLTGRP